MGADGQSRRIAIIGVSTFLLVAMVVAVTVSVNISNKETSGNEKEESKTRVASTMKAVKTLCAPTDYKEDCEESLTAHAGNTTDPRELIKIAFNVTIGRISDGLQKTQFMHEAENDPRTKEALDACKQLMNLSMGELRRSLEKFNKFDLNNLDAILTSLKVWLSGAITYQETCLDAFENTTTDASHKMQDLLQAAMHMSSNGLAIITELSKTLSEMHVTKPGRRLLKDVDDLSVLGHEDDELFELPEWVEDRAGVRRLLHMTGRKHMANVVVAKDGSGNFTTINEALQHVPTKNVRPFVIYIKEGVYNEYVEVYKNMTHVVFIGDGGKKSRITGNKNFIDGVGTYRTASAAISGDFFVAIGMGFENSAGAEKHQAVALRVQSDRSIFYKCRMDGYQDTLYAHTMRQFYRDCIISGTIDFVFGDAVAVLQNCTFVVRKPLENQQCIVTAQGRKEKHQPSGLVIQGGAIVSDPKYYPVRFDNKAYLARPWKNYSRTIFMDTYIGDLITPDGYMPWQTLEGLSGMDTCFYAEYNNRGPGADRSKRVKWQGVKTLTSEGITNFLPSMFFHGDDWIRVTRVPYYSGVSSIRTPTH
ncbi:putative pectinesterase/pectinesterase inhibitor 28 [Cajanus cajan]|uniref:Pectinesterase n=1 Tax=Cajanus cajan TaxID=3821 RepID=A0A151TVZ4_CAJCA|nr:putative pectinesterase/pectinesterase inhibitor 28 [Cajanus cajan]XP_020213146.1 putative pectinesterase/pectinesterase inhibitor 28 [Cajanus cajan]XP_020213147.1 putative pectinesterase/pectinesterase inhibitor 28 [Cajanus cajan]KYP71181.1 Putative pectinesterase/pectinesterase inhibitor 28 [Cajanus cajan]